MAKNIFAGVNNIAKKPSNMYVGVNNIARKVKAVYVGVNGVARQCWPNSKIPNGSYQEVEWTSVIGGIDVKRKVLPRIKINFSINKSGLSQITSFFGSSYGADRNKYFNEYKWYDYDMEMTYPAGYYLYRGWYSDFRNEGNRFITYEQYSKSYSDDDPGTDYDTYPAERYYAGSSSEGILENEIYSLDFMNSNKVYLSCSEGYFSVPSHQLIATFKYYPLNYTPGCDNPDYDPNEYSIKILEYGSDGIKIYSVEVLSGSTYLRNLVPCYRVSDGSIGTYDLVDNYFIPSGYNKNQKPSFIGPTV